MTQPAGFILALAAAGMAGASPGAAPQAVPAARPTASAAATRAAVTDGGARALAISVSGANRTIVLGFVRRETDAKAHPFALDPSLLDVALVSPSGEVAALEAPPAGATSHHATLAGTPATGTDEADLSYAVPRGLEATLYTVRLADRGGALDDKNEPLGLALEAAPSGVYVPAAPDPDVETARERYSGRVVYGYGSSGISMGCRRGVVSVEFEPPSARVVDVRRATGTSADLTFGAEAGNRPPNDFLAVDPLVVTFADAAPSRMTGVSAPSEAAAHAFHGGEHFCELQATYAGLWDLERALARRSVAEHDDWPPQLRRAVASGSIVPGMTREMVAYVWGFPTVYGTAAEMLRLDDWPYVASAPFAHDVRFRDGRVVSVRQPGNLP